MRLIPFCAVLAFALLPVAAQAADSPDAVPSFRRLCAQYAQNRPMAALLGCVNLSDPDMTREEVAEWVEDVCGRMSKECSVANTQRRQQLEGIARSLSCNQTIVDCGGTAIASSAAFDLCRGQVKLSEFNVSGNVGRFLARLDLRDGRRWTLNERLDSLDPQTSSIEAGQWVTAVSRRGGEQATIKEYERRLRDYVDENCDLILKPPPDPTYFDRLTGLLRGWLLFELSCQQGDAACESRAAERRRQVRPKAAAIGNRG